MTTDTHTVWELARLAGCMDPDNAESPGARFLSRVADDYREAIADEWYDDDSPHEIADSAVPVYTHERWQVFVDLGAYQEDISEYGDDYGADLTGAAAVALYMIAERLVYALAQEDETTDDDESDDS